jgi:exonuclease SbcC
MQLQIEAAKDYVDQLKLLEQAYSETLKSYQKSLIRDIEILFHIYSGRIIQDFQGGLGFFIQENNGIKFLTDPAKSFDAIFTMSSGQIAALVISFTLALNKKYSRNKMLFIDDPVQTMDELNIAGFVELLRNDFNDRQIFISTHEDKMSTYMRYKFEKFGLKTKRISMKDKHI